MDISGNIGMDTVLAGDQSGYAIDHHKHRWTQLMTASFLQRMAAQMPETPLTNLQKCAVVCAEATYPMARLWALKLEIESCLRCGEQMAKADNNHSMVAICADLLSAISKINTETER